MNEMFPPLLLTDELPDEYRNVRVAIEFIPREKAPHYLATSRGNRTLRTRQIAKFRDTMNRGEWCLTCQALGFDVDGVLRNGHHTLTALCESTCPGIWSLVVYGLPTESFAGVDAGATRDLADRAHFMGIEMPRREVQITRLWLQLLGRRNVDDNAQMRFFTERKESIKFGRSIAPMTGKYNAIKAVAFPTMLAIAHRVGEEEGLREWWDAVSTGVATEPWQRSAIVLRDWWLRSSKPGGGSEEFRVSTCKRIYYSMRAWKERREIRAARETKIDWLARAG